MAQELCIKDLKQVVENGFVTYTQKVCELASQGYVLDIRNKYCPNFMLSLFTCNMLLLEDEEIQVKEDGSEDIVPQVEVKQKRTYVKANKAKEYLRSKLPAEALQTITK